MQGYLICRIPTVAPEPTSGEVAQVGQLFSALLGSLEFFAWHLSLQVLSSAKTPKKFTEKYPSHSGPLEGVARSLGMTTT
jgi:hypothetical protein